MNFPCVGQGKPFYNVQQHKPSGILDIWDIRGKFAISDMYGDPDVVEWIGISLYRMFVESRRGMPSCATPGYPTWTFIGPIVERNIKSSEIAD